MDSFSRAIQTLILQNENYRLPNLKLGYAVTNKSHPVYQAIVNEIPTILKEKLKEKNLTNYNYIKFKGSTGDGRVGESYWIALLDERVTTSTTNGIYIVLLFDKTVENVYLSIAFGTENIGLTEIKQIANKIRATFAQQIATNKNLNGFSTKTFYLGDKTRAKKFAASACISKKYKTELLSLDELTDDIILLNDIYYKYLYEFYLNEDQDFEEDNPDKRNINKQRKRIIKSEKYSQLRLEREKRNRRIGDLAEKYIYDLEKEKLKNLGLHELAKKVDWVSKREDGHGFDIVSFFPNGSEKYIEVKGSSLAQDDFIFFLSDREKRVAEEKGDSYVLALVQNVGSHNINVFDEIINPLKHIDVLKPTNYIGVKKGKK